MYKILDLFAGAGGLSLGFTQTGNFTILAAAENNKNAQKTYLANHRGKQRLKMIDNVLGFPFSDLHNEIGNIDIIIGGPPCQGFSNANRQKNHVISMNNSLVKEYFRAVRDIKPKAFVMENVSMLSSETHRFYDSEVDHDNIMQLGIEMLDDEILICKQSFEDVDLLEIVQNSEQLQSQVLQENLFKRLNILYKNRAHEEKLEKFLKKNGLSIIKLINQSLIEIDGRDGFQFINRCLNHIKNCLICDQSISIYENMLSQFIAFQKALRITKEIYDNYIICNFNMKENSNILVANVKSYSVIDYINAILNGTYKQKGATINAAWFGVPQERKRYVIIGIRNDIIGDNDIILPKCPDNNIPFVTVKEAIEDLKEYETTVSKDDNGVQMGQVPANISTYARQLRDTEILNNHIITETTSEAMERFKALKEGENFHKLDESLKGTYTNPKRTQNTIYLRLENDKPSGTVVNVRKSMWIHPEFDRAISVREAARLQSFPDSFTLCGTKDSQYQQVGNAVPPKMARAIAECLLVQLNEK